jgi:hypothetical protein
MDTRPVWTMTCFPSNTAPYEVTVNMHTQKLSVTASTSGFTRAYNIVDVHQLSPGFLVTAVGYGRNLQAAFSAQKGMLSTGGGKHDYCSGDL